MKRVDKNLARDLAKVLGSTPMTPAEIAAASGYPEPLIEQRMRKWSRLGKTRGVYRGHDKAGHAVIAYVPVGKRLSIRVMSKPNLHAAQIMYGVRHDTEGLIAG